MALLLTLSSPGIPRTPEAGEPTTVSGLSELGDALMTCEQSRCTQLVYFWSASMPLSQLGVAEITAAATGLDIPVVVAPGDALGAHGNAAEQHLSTALIDAGAKVHFPAVVIVRGGEPQGNAIVGYRRAEGYLALLEPRLRALAAGRTLPRSPVGPPAASVVSGDSHHELRVVWRRPMNPVPGAFYRRLPGTTYIAYDQGQDVYLLDVATGKRFAAPGFVDFVPTPDGRLFVTPGENRSGLEFYTASEVIRLGRLDRTNAFETIFKDTDMTDQYPSVGILSSHEDVTHYRVLTSKFEGLVFRDYAVRWHGIRDPVVVPLTETATICPERGLSTPMISNNGREVAARDESTGTTRIFRIRDDERCNPVLDLGVQTSKVGFSADGGLVAYSAPDGYGRSHTYVLNRRARETVRVPDSQSRGLVIPEMIGSDRLLFLVVSETREKAGVVQTSEFRMACCIQ